MAVDIHNVADSLEARLFGLTTLDTERELRSVLSDLGVLVGGQRAYIFLFDESGTTLDSALEWCAPGTRGHDFSAFRGVPIDAFPWSLEQFLRGDIVQVNDPDVLPEDAAPERGACEALGIFSYVNIPLFVNNELSGWLGFDACDAPRSWDSDELIAMTAAGDLMMKTITRMKREAALTHQQELTSRLATLGVIVSSVRHELQTPLACARANLEALLDSTSTDGATHEILTETLTALEQISGLSRDLGTLRGSASNRAMRVNVRDAIALAVRMTRVLNHTSIPLHVTCDPELTALCPHGRLTQVLINLLRNAFQALRRSGVGDSIQIEAEAREDHVAISIVDNGPGIPPEISQKLFTPFFKSSTEGPGLGLTMSRTICDAMDGALDIASLSPNGTRVTVSVPLAPIQKRVLVVDDEPMILRSWSRALNEYDVSTANSALEALALIDGPGAFDCIITDLHMPIHNGLWLIGQIKALYPSLRDRVAIFTGSFTEDFDIDPSLITLSKTISVSRMRDVIEELCAIN